jgi:hypothetical protein
MGGSAKSPFAQTGETKIPDKKWYRFGRNQGPGDTLIDDGEDGTKKEWQEQLVSDRYQLRSHMHEETTTMDMELETWKVLPTAVIQHDLMPGEESEKLFGLSCTSFSSYGLQRQTSNASSIEQEMTLRSETNANPSQFDTEVEPWPMLDENVIPDDICTDKQAMLDEKRQHHWVFPLPRPKMEHRRLAIQKHFDAAWTRAKPENALVYPMLSWSPAFSRKFVL